MTTITVNGKKRDVQSPADTPLLYALRNELDLTATQFGCGVAQCGACSVLLDGREIRSCTTTVAAAAGKEVTTLEGLPARWAKQRNLSEAVAAKTLHPVQEGWIEEQTPLCGFCQSGMMIAAADLLERIPHPTLAQVKESFTNTAPSAHLCRCGTYNGIAAAVLKAAKMMSA